MKKFEVEFHGVRGSCASPGNDTREVGGNTSCVEVRLGDTSLVLDAGTGLRNIGDRLMTKGASDTTLLLSHLHWDHIQGLPFFSPLYVPGHTVRVISGPNGFMPLEQALRRQMAPPFFPVAFDDVAPRVSTCDVRANESFSIAGAKIICAKLNHPDPVFGYRIEVGGKSVVYATDTEHYSCVDPTLRQLAKDADILIYDAQYTPEEYRGERGPARVGWGHSTYEAAAELSRAAGVKQLVLFHHDPRRTDDGVREIEARAQACFADTVAAREGLVIDVRQAEIDDTAVRHARAA